jgi:hypothetical protein
MLNLILYIDMHHLRSHSSAAEDSKFLRNDAVVLGEWFPHISKEHNVFIFRVKWLQAKQTPVNQKVWNFRAYNSAC